MSETSAPRAEVSDVTSSRPLGTLWEIKSKSNVRVTRPDGSVVTVFSDGSTAGYVLDVPGEFSAKVGVDGKPITVTAE